MAAVCELQFQLSAATKDHYWLLMMTPGPVSLSFPCVLGRAYFTATPADVVAAAEARGRM